MKKIKIVRLKKDVDFSKLAEYGFVYNEQSNTYVRPSSWALKTVGIRLTVDVESRAVYTHVFYADEVNEAFGENSMALHSTTLLSMYDLLEIGDFELTDEEVIMRKKIFGEEHGLI